MTEKSVRVMEIQKFGLFGRYMSKRAIPSFEIELTARCNNDCRHCFINLPAGDKALENKEISLEMIKNVAQQAIDMGALWCLLTGGEPLLRKDFADIYITLKKMGLLVQIFTNATLINNEHIKLFQKYPPRDIEISVYGVTEKTYESVTRKKGSFAAFMNGLNLLLESDIHVRLKTIPMRSNIHEMKEISDFCRSHTKDFFRFDPVLHLRYDGNRARNQEILAERLSPEVIVELEQSDTKHAESLLKKCDVIFLPQNKKKIDDRLFSCYLGFGSFVLGYDGYFRPCGPLNHPDFKYDLTTGTLEEAWNTFVPSLHQLKITSEELLNTCSRCPIVNLCIGCAAHMYLENGDFSSVPTYFCEVAHAREKLLNKIRTSEKK